MAQHFPGYTLFENDKIRWYWTVIYVIYILLAMPGTQRTGVKHFITVALYHSVFLHCYNKYIPYICNLTKWDQYLWAVMFVVFQPNYWGQLPSVLYYMSTIFIFNSSNTKEMISLDRDCLPRVVFDWKRQIISRECQSDKVGVYQQNRRLINSLAKLSGIYICVTAKYIYFVAGTNKCYG